MAGGWNTRNRNAPMKPMTRRDFFERITDGIYGTALTTLLAGDLYGSTAMLSRNDLPEGHRRIYDLKPRSPHSPPKAKAVIQLFMNGGPSQVDLFDPKPMLDKHDGEPYFDKLAADLTGPEGAGGLMRSPFIFKQHGKAGIWVSDLMPHLVLLC
jgi:Protein of unknown function (DUF1501)